MKAPVIFGFVSLGVLAFACAPRARNADSAQAANTKRSSAPAIESALDVSVGAGNSVQFDFVVTNAGGGKVEMAFPTGQTHDVIVLDAQGREVWRWSDGRMFTQLLQNKILRHSDTLVYGEKWKDAPRGEYVAVARLASANYPIEQRTAFVVR